MYIDDKNHKYVGGSMTKKLPDGTLWSGIPTSQQLEDWGYLEYSTPIYIPTEQDVIQQRMNDILEELKATDYLALKAFEGEDMSEHPNWKEYRANLRIEYRQLEEDLQELYNPVVEEIDEEINETIDN